MNVQRVLSRGLLAAVPALVMFGAVAGPASAKDGDVQARGACSGASVWKLKAGPRDGGIETEFQVDSNRNGQSWSVRITDNNVQVFAGTRKTVAPSGSFTVERRIANRAGSDMIVATARNAATGERCSATVNV